MGAFDAEFGQCEGVPGQPIPIKASVGEPAPFPIDALPPKLRAAVEAVRDKAQVPAAIAAQSVLGAISLAAQCRVNIRLPTDEVMPCSLFLFTVAASGDRKSSADKWALQPIRACERSLFHDYRDRMLAYEIDMQAYTAATAEAKRKGGKDRDLIRENLSNVGKPPLAPPGPDLLVEEPTMQAIVKMMAESMPSLGLFSDEGAQFLGGYSMSEEHQAASGAQLSQFWDGKTIKRIRASEKQLVQHLAGRRLSVHLMMQPGVAMKAFANKGTRDQGLMSRILCAFPKSLKGERLWQDTTEVTDHSLREYHGRLESLMRQPMVFVDDVTRELALEDMALTDEARRLYIEFNDHVERQLGPGGLLEEISDLASKLPQHAMRLACVVAYFESRCKITGDGRRGVTAAALACGIKLAQFYAGEALRLFNAGSVDEDSDNAAAVIEFIHKKEMKIVGHRWLSQRAPKHVRAAKVLGRAVDLLVEWGHLVAIKGGALVPQDKGPDKHERRAYNVIYPDPAE